jgi:hypothetical protein
MIVRSKKSLVYDSRDSKEEVIALRISSWIREERFNRFKAVVEDLLVKDVVDPLPGEPLKTYEIFKSQEVIRTNSEIDALFNFIGVPIEIGDSYTTKQQQLIAQALLIDTQSKPVYGSTAEDWEVIDESQEVAPDPAA